MLEWAQKFHHTASLNIANLQQESLDAPDRKKNKVPRAVKEQLTNGQNVLSAASSRVNWAWDVS